MAIFLNFMQAKIYDLDSFKKELNKNSLTINENRAKYQSTLNDMSATLAYEAPHIESQIDVVRNGAGVSNNSGLESATFLMFTPRLPWVSAMLKNSISYVGTQYQKSHTLIGNLNFIGAKRVYLNLIEMKQKYIYYVRREKTFEGLLESATKRLQAGRLSNRDYVNFLSAYRDSSLAVAGIKNEIIELQKMLFMALGIKDGQYFNATNENIQTDDIVVNGIDFEFLKLDSNALEQWASKSLYLDILDLDAKNYDSMAKYNGRNLFSTLQIGAGINQTMIQNGMSDVMPSVKVIVPLSFTGKNAKLKAKYMALSSSALIAKDITKNNISIQAQAYLNELKVQENYINIAKKNIESKRELARLSYIAYQSSNITLFEYINYENAFVDSQIALVDLKIKYIDVLSKLEETLGMSFINEKE